MVPDYLSDIKPLEDQGLDDAAIISWLSSIHARDVLVTADKPGVIDIHHMLTSKAKVLKIDKNTGAWSGALIDFFTSNPGHPLEPLLEELLANAHTSNRTLYCGTDAATGAGTTAMTDVVKGLLDAGLGNPNITSLQFQAQMDELTGGKKFSAGVTQQNLIDARNDYNAVVVASGKRTATLEEVRRIQNNVIPAINTAVGDYYKNANYNDVNISVEQHVSGVLNAAKSISFDV